MLWNYYLSRFVGSSGTCQATHSLHSSVKNCDPQNTSLATALTVKEPKPTAHLCLAPHYQ